MNLVSIIIPYFKKSYYIESCVKSILDQTYKNFEILIINDECTTDSKIFLRKISFLDNRIKIISNKKNFGAGISRNIGVSKSKGNFLAFLDADDTWKKSKLKSQINLMIKNNYLLTHTNYYIINESDKKIGKHKVNKYLNYKDLLKSCDIGLSTVVINSNIKSDIKFPNLKTKEDYALWLRLCKKYKLIGINKFYTNWRKLNNSLSSSVFRKIIDDFIVYYKYEKFSFIKSLFFVINLSFFAVKKKYKQYFI